MTTGLRFTGVAAFLLLSGCALTNAQRDAIGQFGLAAGSLGETASAQVVVLRGEAIRMNIERLALGGESKDPRLGGEQHLDKGFEIAKVETLVGATNALSAYGKALAALATSAEAATLKTATDKLVASLAGLPGMGEHLSSKQLSALGTTVQEVGGLWVEWKRKQAVHAIVSGAAPAIAHLCDLLMRDFRSGGWVETQLLLLEAPLIGTATNAFRDRTSLADRRAALNALQLAQESAYRREYLLAHVVDAAASMKKANAALVQAVENDPPDIVDIQAFVARAARLRDAVQVLVSKN